MRRSSRCPRPRPSCGVGKRQIASSRSTLLGDQRLLAEVVGVMAGIDLVGDELEQPVRGDRQVDVDRDARAQVAEVVAEPAPRLVRHEHELDLVAVGQPEERVRALAELGGERLERRRRPCSAGRAGTRARRRSARAASPRRAARRRAGRGRPRTRPRARARLDLVAAANQLRVRDLARPRTSGTRSRAPSAGAHRAARVVGLARRPQLELGASSAMPLVEVGGSASTRALSSGGPAVAVDQVGLQPAEAERELQVLSPLRVAVMGEVLEQVGAGQHPGRPAVARDDDGRAAVRQRREDRVDGLVRRRRRRAAAASRRPRPR